jgi:hypothetical protein
MLMWRQELWLIDHGASLYFHHSWDNWEEQATRPFAKIKDHVLLPQATQIAAVDGAFRAILTPERIRAIVNLVPEEWLTGQEGVSAAERREVYVQFLTRRVASSEIFVKEAQQARSTLI